jgi:phosphate-selective porin OprO and OprP
MLNLRATVGASAVAVFLACSAFAQTSVQRLPADVAGAAPAQAAKTGLVWDGRPALRYGDTFDVELKLLVLANVRRSALDLSTRGGTLQWDIRRATIKGTVLKYFEFEVQHDLDSGGKWRDVYLNVRPAVFAQVQFGQFKIPFGFEWLTGRSSLDFVNRTRVSDAIAAGRDVGVMLHGRAFKKVIRYQAGVFKHDGDGPPKLHPMDLLPGEQPGSRSRAYAARVTIAPLRLGSIPGKYNDLEIGGAFTSSTVPEGRNHLQGVMALGDKFFDRQYYTGGRRLRTGIEMSWDIGPASLRAEFLRCTEARNKLGVGNEGQLDNDLPEIVSQGWYASGAWVLTGEKREGGVTPKHPFLQGGIGAIELAARYEQLRFSTPGGQSETASDSRRAANILANGERAVTAGVNWYVNRWVMLRVDGMREQIDEAALGPVPSRTSFWTVVSQLQVGF